MKSTLKYYDVKMTGTVYGNKDRWVICAVDQHGVWRGPTGSYINPPDPANIGEELDLGDFGAGVRSAPKEWTFKRAFVVAFGGLTGLLVAWNVTSIVVGLVIMGAEAYLGIPA
jgi:hypothetical protein